MAWWWTLPGAGSISAAIGSLGLPTQGITRSRDRAHRRAPCAGTGTDRSVGSSDGRVVGDQTPAAARRPRTRDADRARDRWRTLERGMARTGRPARPGTAALAVPLTDHDRVSVCSKSYGRIRGLTRTQKWHCSTELAAGPCLRIAELRTRGEYQRQQADIALLTRSDQDAGAINYAVMRIRDATCC